jgi:D-alanyl-D-alanine carboxypeptidase
MPVLSAQSRAPAIALRNAFVALAIALAAMLFAPVALAASKSSALLPLDKAAMQRTVETMARVMLVPGVVVILGTPAGETRLTYGTTTIHGTEKVTANQRIRVGSNTKTWTGTVILQQVQEGRLRLEDPVSKFRQDVPNGDNITITQLLDMRSGLYNYSETEELNQTLDREPGKAWTQHELLALAFKHPRTSRPVPAITIPTRTSSCSD